MAGEFWVGANEVLFFLGGQVVMAGDCWGELGRGARDCRYGGQIGIDDRDGHQVENHLPWEAAFCSSLGGLWLAGAGILTEPAIIATHRMDCTATSYGR